MYLFHRKLIYIAEIKFFMVTKYILVLVISAWCFEVLDYNFHCKNNFLHLILNELRDSLNHEYSILSLRGLSLLTRRFWPTL